MTGHISRRGEHSWRIKFDAGRDATTGKRNVQYVTVRGTKKQAQVDHQATGRQGHGHAGSAKQSYPGRISSIMDLDRRNPVDRAKNRRTLPPTNRTPNYSASRRYTDAGR